MPNSRRAGHPTAQRILAEHPALAVQLEACLAGIEFVHRATGSDAGETPAQLGEFRIVRELGRGGMGVVYEAEQTSLRRRVALKVLRFGVVADPEAMERFQREAETVARLHHTNIVPIFAVGSERGVQYYAMQFIDGRSLADVQAGVERGEEAPSSERVVRWGLQAAEALAHAHQRGVIHRDVKPSNLMLDAEGVVWLTDFGLAKRADEVTLTVSGALMGTPRYMSPEQVEAIRRPVDHRTDLYSLGATLYELATGRALFAAATPHGVLSQILTEEPTHPRLVRPVLSRDLETVVLKCLAKDPGKRYATAQALADDLRAVLDGRPIQARRAPWTERFARAVAKQKKAMRVAAIAVVASLLLVAGSYGAWRWYADWRLGRAVLTTDGPPITAEVLAASGETPVTEPFTIGINTPLALPAGDYRLRLKAPGRLGRTVNLALNRGESLSHRVSLEGGLLLGSEAIPYALVTDAIVFGPGRKADLVEWTGQTLVRRDGVTGKPVWDLARPAKPWPSDRDSLAWMRRLVNRGDEKRPGRILVPAPDLDGDGTADLVLAFTRTPSLLALSGRDGSFLWASTTTADGPRTADVSPGVGWVVGQPIATELDHDGRPDLIATFALCSEETAVNGVLGSSRGKHLVAAVSGRTGRALWSHTLDTAPLKLEVKDIRDSPVLFQRRGTFVVGVLVRSTWQTLEPATGRLVGAAIDFGFEPIRPVQNADLDGDGSDELLALGPGSTLTGANQDQILSAVSTATGRPLWTVTVRGGYRPDRHAGAPNWPLLADLDNDGRTEVAVPDWGRFPSSGGYRGVALLDGKTGQSRWSRPLQPWTSWNDGLDHLAVTPDLDGDGVRDLVAESRFHGRYMYHVANGRPADRPRLYVDALSGRGGRPLWRWHRELDDEITPVWPPRWWGRGADGGPLLAIPVGGDLADSTPSSIPGSARLPQAADVHILAASSGREAHTIVGLTWPQAADLDGDGLDDLWGMAEVRLAAFRGEVPEAWRALGAGKPAGDLDGDGVADVVSGDLSPPVHANPAFFMEEPSESRTIVARSGRDGQVLWQAALDGSAAWMPHYRSYQIISFPHGGDFDGDGAGDIVVFKETALLRPSEQLPLEVRSGRTGKRLWSVGSLPTATIAIPKGYQPYGGLAGARSSYFLGTDVFQPTGQRGPDLLVLRSVKVSVQQIGVKPGPGGVVSHAVVSRLSRLSGRDGRLIWDIPLNEPALEISYSRTFPHRLGDLDGDGCPDLVVAIHAGLVPAAVPPGDPVPDRRNALVAVSLREGKRLWSRPLRHVDRPTTFAVGDLDGDGSAEVVVADQPPDGTKEPVELSGVDGRDGATRWTWRGGNESDRNRLEDFPLRLVAFEGKGPRSTCLNVGLPNNARRLVLLDEKGREKAGQVLGSRWWTTLENGDLTGDGREELLIKYDDKLRAVGSDLKEHWSRPGKGTISEILSGRAGAPATVIAYPMVGLDGATGRPRWTALTLGGVVLDQGSKTEPTRVLLGTPGMIACGLALATDPAGNLVPPRVMPASSAYELHDPRWIRPLPWSSNGSNMAISIWILISPALSLINLGVPYVILRLATRRRVWGLPLLLALPVIVAIPLAELLIQSTGEPGTPPSNVLAILVACSLVALPALVYVYSLTVSIFRRRWGRLAVILGLNAVISVMMGAYMIRADRRLMQSVEFYDWSEWYAVLPPGDYLAGGLLTATGAITFVARRLRRWVARHKAMV